VSVIGEIKTELRKGWQNVSTACQ